MNKLDNNDKAIFIRGEYIWVKCQTREDLVFESQSLNIDLIKYVDLIKSGNYGILSLRKNGGDEGIDKPILCIMYNTVSMIAVDCFGQDNNDISEQYYQPIVDLMNYLDIVVANTNMDPFKYFGHHTKWIYMKN